MTQESIGIKTTGADHYVAAFTAAEQAEGQNRVIQIISLTSGKFDSSVGAPARSVSSNDALDISTVIGNIEVGDSSHFACYVKHSQPNGSCLVTPLLCDNNGEIIGVLESKKSQVMLPVVSGTEYLSQSLSWSILGTGAWKLYSHVTDLSTDNSVDIWCFTF